jgi:hypothetical protein
MRTFTGRRAAARASRSPRERRRARARPRDLALVAHGPHRDEPLARFRRQRRAHDRGAPGIGRAALRDRFDDDAHAVEHGPRSTPVAALALRFEHLAQQIGDADQALVARERAQERLHLRQPVGQVLSWSTDR